jgi:hypothetical protein
LRSREILSGVKLPPARNVTGRGVYSLTAACRQDSGAALRIGGKDGKQKADYCNDRISENGMKIPEGVHVLNASKSRFDYTKLQIIF